jgi:hypothetical protein
MNCNNINNNNKISFSQLKIWNECAYKHKISYVDEVKLFKGNEYTAFGTSIHTVCENLVFGKDVDFDNIFENEIKSLEIDVDDKLISSMKLSAPNIIKEIMPSLNDQFKEYEVFSVEEELCVKIDDDKTEGKNVFKGFIDLVLKIGDDYHIIDWKTCSWGWNAKKRSDPMVVYQLMFYKHFFAKKHNIDLDKIHVHFALLKRTAKSNFVEIFKTTSGNRRIANSLNVLNNAIHNIDNKNYTKNKLSCSRCEYHRTQYCK